MHLLVGSPACAVHAVTAGRTVLNPFIGSMLPAGVLLHVAAAYQVFSMNVYTAIEEQLTDVSGCWGISCW